MTMEEFEELENAIPGLPIPATPANVALARNFVFRKWRERADEQSKPDPKDLTDSCKFTSQFAMIVFGGYLQGNEKHQFIRTYDQKILDLNKDAYDVQALIDDPHAHDEGFFGNPEHEESMASCRPTVISWIADFVKLLRQKGVLGEKVEDIWAATNAVRNRVLIKKKMNRVDPQMVADALGAVLDSKGYRGRLVHGRIHEQDHSWITIDGMVIDPLSEKFTGTRHYLSRIGDLPYIEIRSEEFGMGTGIDLREEKTSKPGMFVGVKFSSETIQNLIRWSDQNGLTSRTPPEKYHTTVFLNRSKKFAYDPIRWNPPLIVDPDSFHLELFRNDDVLVLTYDCPELTERHQDVRKRTGLPWDYDDYTAHVTLSDFDKPFHGNIDDFSLPDFPLEIVTEYVKDYE